VRFTPTAVGGVEGEGAEEGGEQQGTGDAGEGGKEEH